jgi:hypothetical protein
MFNLLRYSLNSKHAETVVSFAFFVKRGTAFGHRNIATVVGYRLDLSNSPAFRAGPRQEGPRNAGDGLLAAAARGQFQPIYRRISFAFET